MLGIRGHRAFNIHLDRHRKEVDQTQLYGPLREDSEIWEEHLTAVLEDSERMQSAASQEIDALLRKWGIKKAAAHDEEKGKGAVEEGSMANDEDNSKDDEANKSKSPSGDALAMIQTRI